MNRNPDDIIRELLEIRGIRGEETINEFLADRPSVAHDPFLLHNMEAGVDLILDEIGKGSRFCIYGDYDADGVTSVCVLISFLSHLTSNLTHYIPSRFSDGYGLNKGAIERIRKEGADVLVTVDCGSVSYEEVEYAKSLGLQVIVTDHHTIDRVQADCILINPKQKDCQYPFKGLAGCGVAFKLCQAIRMRTGLPREVLNDCLDLVAIGTVADIVPLTDENRTIVKYGLIKINQGSRLSVRTLAAGISLKDITSENIAFGIAPHINAAGRMGSAEDAVQLFLAADEETARRQTEILKDRNYARKSLQDKTYRECLEEIRDTDDFIVIVKEGIHEGISGIVAGKIKEELGRPCVIMTRAGDGRMKGTGRSIDRIDLYDFLKEFAGLFDTFGGHKGACGFTLPEEHVPVLAGGIREKIRRMKEQAPDLLEKPVQYDLVLSPGEITAELYAGLKRMEPFGAANPVPVFKLQNVTPSDIRWMGDRRQHVRFTVRDGTGQVSCILFGRGEAYREALCAGEPLSITGTIDINQWNGRTTVQCKVEDIII